MSSLFYAVDASGLGASVPFAAAKVHKNFDMTKYFVTFFLFFVIFFEFLGV